MKSKINLLHFLNRVAESNIRTLNHPYKLNYCISYWCQSRCLTCNIWQMRPKNELRLDEIENFCKKSRGKFNWLQITGGEPFVRSDIDKIAEIFNKYNLLYIISSPTNSLCNPKRVYEKVKRILDMKESRFVLTLSLDGFGDLHDYIRGIKGNFVGVCKTYETMKPLLKEYSKFKIVFGYTMSKFNEGKLETTIRGMQELYPEISYNDFHVNKAQNSENYYSNSADDITPNPNVSILELRNLLDKRIKKPFETMDFIEREFIKGLIYFTQYQQSPIQSKELEVSCYMDSYGNIFPSIMTFEKIGNIREVEYDLNALWTNNEAKRVRVNNLKHNPRHVTSCEYYQSRLAQLI